MGVHEDVKGLEEPNRRVVPPLEVPDQFFSVGAEELAAFETAMGAGVVAEADGPFVRVGRSGENLLSHGPGVGRFDLAEPVQQRDPKTRVAVKKARLANREPNLSRSVAGGCAEKINDNGGGEFRRKGSEVGAELVKNFASLARIRNSFE